MYHTQQTTMVFRGKMQTLHVYTSFLVLIWYENKNEFSDASHNIEVFLMTKQNSKFWNFWK